MSSLMNECIRGKLSEFSPETVVFRDKNPPGVEVGGVFRSCAGRRDNEGVLVVEDGVHASEKAVDISRVTMVRLTRNRDPEIEILRGLSLSVAAAAAGGAGGGAAGNAGAGVAGEAGLRVRVSVLGAARVGGGGGLGRVVKVKLVEDVEEPVGLVHSW